MAGGARKRLGIVGGVLACVVLAAGGGLYATDTWPFGGDSYCWGAWQENSGAAFLGEDGLAKSEAERKGSASAAPSADNPRGTCTVAVNSTVEDDDSDEPLTFDERIVVDYGPVPATAKKRYAWLARHFDGSTAPLPDGLNGMVAGDRAMLVLPKACDVDGRPSVVTMRGESWGDGHLGKLAMPFSIGTYSDVIGMLLDVANTGMDRAGCAPDEPLRITSPLVHVAEKSERARRPLCRIPGTGFDLGRAADYREQAGAVTPRLQTCSVVMPTRGEPDEPVAQYVMTGEPRLAALFDGLPEGTRHGLTHATCDGRRTAFYGHVAEDGPVDDAAAERSFKNFVKSVSSRIECEKESQA